MKKIIVIMTLVMSIVISAAGCASTKAVEDQPNQSEKTDTVGDTTTETDEESSEPETQAEPIELIVSAAASMKDAMLEIQDLYQQENTNITVTMNFGSSGSLQQQIEQGAPADVFVSASIGKMDNLRDKSLIQEDTYTELLENKIVLIVPKGNEAEVAGFDDINTDKIEKLAIGEPDSVPAGKYAKETLTNLGLWDELGDKVLEGKDVRSVLSWVETENADAGIVYATDAQISDQVEVVATAPDDSHSPVIYPAAVVKDTKQAEAAKAFVDYLKSDKGKEVFESFGFSFLE